MKDLKDTNKNKSISINLHSLLGFGLVDDKHQLEDYPNRRLEEAGEILNKIGDENPNGVLQD
jgi:hypothetical protein